jgi:hypothetical protein
VAAAGPRPDPPRATRRGGRPHRLEPRLLDTTLVPGTNPIGWLVWHLTRSHDRNVSEVRGAGQLWVTAGWHDRFGRRPDPGETGFQHTADDVAGFRSPAADVLRDYHRAVVQMVDDYVATAPDDDLHRLVTSPTLGNTLTVHRRLVGVLAEGLEHVGQAAALRGALERLESQPPPAG